jgi:hypothetical protein
MMELGLVEVVSCSHYLILAPKTHMRIYNKTSRRVYGYGHQLL